MRPSKRAADELRPINIKRNYTKYAEGSVLIEYGDTKVLCTATIENTVPKFLQDSGQGWVTAEYGMLPRSTGERTKREASSGRQGGRTLEIQRLIGRSLRAAIDLKLLGQNTIIIDCDVIQADGGTRTAAITGGCVALADAVQCLKRQQKLTENPFKNLVAAISVGIYQGVPILDLDYAEDVSAEVDMNVVIIENDDFIELQGTAETASFNRQQLDTLLELAKTGTKQLFIQQRLALKMT